MKRRTAIIILVSLILLMVVMILLAYLLYSPKESGAGLGILQAYFLDVGQGDSTLLIFPNNKTVLIDGGKDPSVLDQYLSLLNILYIDEVIATHPDSDHIGGLVRVSANYGIGEYISNCDSCTTDICQDLQQELHRKNILQTCAASGDRISIQEGIDVKVLNPQPSFFKGDNDNSIVILLTYNGFSMLLMADCEAACERSIMNEGVRLRSDVLKVGHHGSGSSSSAQFLNKVNPDMAIISVGKNSYGHPHGDVLSRLVAAGAQSWRTDESGTLLVITDGISYNLSRWP